MKTKLTIEESARLIELGVDAELASEDKVTYDKNDKPYCHPIYTLSDLLSILPKEIDGYYLNMSACANEWNAYYEKIELLGRRIILRTNCAPELIDALNQLLIWCLENGYVNLNTDKK